MGAPEIHSLSKFPALKTVLLTTVILLYISSLKRFPVSLRKTLSLFSTQPHTPARCHCHEAYVTDQED